MWISLCLICLALHWASWILYLYVFCQIWQIFSHSSNIFSLPQSFSPSNDMITSKYFTTVPQVSAHFFFHFFCPDFRMDNFCCSIVTFITLFCLLYSAIEPIQWIFFKFPMLYLLIPKFLFCSFCIISIFLPKSSIFPLVLSSLIFTSCSNSECFKVFVW